MTLAMALTATLRRLLDVLLVALIITVLVSLAVARILPAVTGGPTFVVGGGSMEPSIPIGSVVIDLPVAAADLRAGDVVSVKVGPEQAVFTHRITRTLRRDGAVWIQTRGDANPSDDPTIIPATAVAGRVSVMIPYLGYPIQLLSSLMGLAFLLSIGMVALLGAWVLETLEDDQRAWAYRRSLDRGDLLPLPRDATRSGGLAG